MVKLLEALLRIDTMMRMERAHEEIRRAMFDTEVVIGGQLQIIDMGDYGKYGVPNLTSRLFSSLKIAAEISQITDANYPVAWQRHQPPMVHHRASCDSIGCWQLEITCQFGLFDWFRKQCGGHSSSDLVPAPARPGAIASNHCCRSERRTSWSHVAQRQVVS